MANGKLFARLAYVNGRTRLVEHHQSAPLKIARTFEREDGGLDICVMDASPGLLAGDSYEFEWVLEEGAKARFTTQGATRVHPSTGPPSLQSIRASVAEGAHLELWPESTIPFSQARFVSSTEISLAEGAKLIVFESLSAGRIARGEVFEFERVKSSLHVHDALGPRLYTSNEFKPDGIGPSGRYAWNENRQWSSLYAFGYEGIPVAATAEWLERMGFLGGVSTLARGDTGVTLLGMRAHDLRSAALAIERLWNLAVSRETL